jgi:hypothetical protein
MLRMIKGWYVRHAYAKMIRSRSIAATAAAA